MAKASTAAAEIKVFFIFGSLKNIAAGTLSAKHRITESPTGTLTCVLLLEDEENFCSKLATAVLKRDKFALL